MGYILHIKTDEGLLYLAIVIDLYSRAVIVWSMNKRINKHFADAILMTLWRHSFPKGVIMHSDRGSQYYSKKYQSLLKMQGLTCSMSRKGNC